MLDHCIPALFGLGLESRGKVAAGCRKLTWVGLICRGRPMLSLLYENLRKAWHVRYPTGILCHRFQFIFFPVPKAASSSIRKVIAEMEGLPSERDPHHGISFDLVWAKSLHAYSDYRKFTVVRNPWDRLVSCFKDKVQERHNGRAEVLEGFERYNKILRTSLFYPTMTFAEFVNVIAKIPDAVADEHFRSQYRMFCGPDGTPLVDRVLKFEDLQDELRHLFSELGARDYQVTHMNRSNTAEYKRLYSDPLAEIVERRYRKDIKLLNYAF
jgi:chondroitin 4-sulfotransferase 11